MTFIILVLIQLAVFGTLIFVLKNVIQRHLGSATSHLEALTQDSEKRFSESKKKVDEANAYHEETLAKAKAEGEKLRQELINEGLKEKQEQIERARKEGDAIMERARSAHKLLEENWDSELTQRAREVTARILRTVLPEKISRSLQNDWVDAALVSELEGLSHLNISDEVTSVEIVSAVPLAGGQKSALLAKLSEKIGRELKAEERIDDTLILGFCLIVGSVVLDNSLAWKLKEALQHDGNEKNG